MSGGFVNTLLAIVNPPPVSPYFQAGGPLEGWSEDLVFVGAALIALFVLDNVVVKPLLPSARYFALHAACNLVIAVASFPDFWKVFINGWPGFVGPTYTMVANSVALSIHVYHCLAFNLTWDDIFHHVVFASVLCGLAIPFKQIGGALNNFGCFVLTGVPGGIDYLMLVLVKQGLMDKLTEKSWNAFIQSWIRAPLMAIYAWNAFQLWLNADELAFHPIVLFIVAFLHILNGVYYTKQAVETWARHDQMAVMNKKK